MEELKLTEDQFVRVVSNAAGIAYNFLSSCWNKLLQEDKEWFIAKYTR